MKCSIMLHFIWVFNACKSTCLGVSGIQMVNVFSKADLSKLITIAGAQWLSARVLDSRPRGWGFEPHRRHCVVVLEQDTFIQA